MRTEIDLDAAAKAGIIGEDQAIRLRNFQSERDGISNASSEKFQLFGGYADLVVGIGAAMVLGAVWLFMIELGKGSNLDGESVVAGLIGIVIPVMLFKISQRINIRAAPATALTLTIAFAAFSLFGLVAIIAGALDLLDMRIREDLVIFGLLTAPHIGVLWLHWRNFRFPPTIAMVIAGYSFLILEMLRNETFGPLSGTDLTAAVALTIAIGTMIAAIWWDLTDIRRETERSQVAFWLHCCAGVLMSRALFSLLTGTRVTDGDLIFTGLSLSDFPFVLAMIFFAALLSLLLDRRSLLVGCLLPIVGIFDGVGSSDDALMAGLFVAGTALIFFSTTWIYLRTRLLNALPVKLAAQLPRTNLTATGQRPSRQHAELWRLK